MRVVIDGLPVRGDSLSIVSEHLLQGWQELDNGDELHLVVGPDPQIAIPDAVRVHPATFGRSAAVSRLYAQSVVVPRLCRALDADVMLGLLPTTTITPLPCPRVIIAYDVRYRLRPEQFSRKSLFLRRSSYGLGFRQADGIVCISERTRRDLLSFYPALSARPVRAAHLGADHVDTWRKGGAEGEYAIAFGHYANKNVDLVLEGWAALAARPGPTLPLRLTGVSGRERPRLMARIAELGLGDVVTVNPWLPVDEFEEQFASSSMVVFPSDFEGFGLPAVEAMRLGIPVVITPEPALLEVSGGHATVIEGTGPEGLARAVEAARHVTPEALAAATAHAAAFTWAAFAAGVRGVLAEVTAPPGATTSPGATPPTDASTAAEKEATP